MTTKQLLKEMQSQIEKMEVTSCQNPAVALCCRAWTLTFSHALLEDEAVSIAKFRARKAFCLSMPALDGERNIRDFIACTTFGMLFDVIEPKEASKLMYAAQVASTAARVSSRLARAAQQLDSPATEPPQIAPAAK